MNDFFDPSYDFDPIHRKLQLLQHALCATLCGYVGRYFFRLNCKNWHKVNQFQISSSVVTSGSLDWSGFFLSSSWEPSPTSSSFTSEFNWTWRKRRLTRKSVGGIFGTRKISYFILIVVFDRALFDKGVKIAMTIIIHVALLMFTITTLIAAYR